MLLESIFMIILALAVMAITAIFFTKVFLCIVAVLLIWTAIGAIKEKRTRRVLKGYVDLARTEFPDASNTQLEAIAEKLRLGSKVDEFWLEDGQLTHKHLDATTYFRSKCKWTKDPKSSDPNGIYESQKIEVINHFSGMNLNENDIHELAVMLYFNWEFHSTRMEGQSARIIMGRRGERRAMVFKLNDSNAAASATPSV